MDTPSPESPDPHPHRPDTRPDIDRAIAGRLRALRAARGWTLSELAARSGVSRTTLSRLENAEASATAAVLGRLCAAYGLPVSRLMMMAEGNPPPLVRRAAQQVWTDPGTGFRRRAVSPPGAGLAAEIVEGALPAGREIAYPVPPRPGIEHHLLLLEGRLEFEHDGETHPLAPGDCLRYRLKGPSRFATDPAGGARYLLVSVAAA